MEERWNDEAWATSTGKIRYGNTTFRESNFHYSCVLFSGRFVRSFSIFFSFLLCLFSLVLSSVFLSFSISSAPVLVHNIRTRLDASTPRRDVSREQQTDIHPGTKREILFPLAETCNRRTISHRLNRDLFLSTVLFVHYAGCLTVQPFVYGSEISNFIKPIMSSLEFFSAYLACPFVCFLILWIFFFLFLVDTRCSRYDSFTRIIKIIEVDAQVLLYGLRGN